MTMIEVNSVDAVPGEAELLAVAADYFASRLFTLRQRRTLSVMVDITSQQVRVPVTRAMLGPQRAGFGTKAPTMFEMTVSTAAGIRDAAETIAHELVHISQAVNGRLTILSKRRKIDGRKVFIDFVRWMGGKPLVMDNLAWHLRPWEVEACHWQRLLVDEFLGLATGNGADQPVQSGKRKQLALYPVKAPAIVPAQPEPDFHQPMTGGNVARQDAGDRIASNDESIDRVISGAMPDEPAMASQQAEATNVHPGSTDDIAEQINDVVADEMPAVEAADHEMVRDMPDQHNVFEPASTPEPASDMAAGLPEPSQMTLDTADDIVSDTAGPTLPAALPDTPVYKRPVIEVEVPGLDAPRALGRDAMMKKLDELRQRGLASAAKDTKTK